MPIPIAGAMLGSALLGAAGSIIGTSESNSSNIAIAKQNQEWQTLENQKNRDWQENQNLLSRNWQEKMWNLQNQYNTPSAMMQRYKEAGLNPYLVTQDSGLGAAGSAGSPSVGSPSMVGAPNMPNIQPVDYGAPFSRAVDIALRSKAVDADAANQRSQAVKSLVDAATEGYKTGGMPMFRSIVSTFAPYLLGTNPETDGLLNKQITSEIRMNVANAVSVELQNDLVREFGRTNALNGIQKFNYECSEIVARLNTMRINNEIAIKKLANDTLVSAAQAFNLQKQGNYYVASADQVSRLTQYVVREARAQAELSEQASSRSAFETSVFLEPENREKYRESYGIDLDISSDRTHRYIREIEEGLGNVIHVGYGKYEGLNTSTSTSTINSNSNSSSYTRFEDVTPWKNKK